MTYLNLSLCHGCISGNELNVLDSEDLASVSTAHVVSACSLSAPHMARLV